MESIESSIDHIHHYIDAVTDDDTDYFIDELIISRYTRNVLGDCDIRISKDDERSKQYQYESNETISDTINNASSSNGLFETIARPIRKNTEIDLIHRDLFEVGYSRLEGLSSDDYHDDREDIYSQLIRDCTADRSFGVSKFMRKVDTPPVFLPPERLPVSSSSGIVSYYESLYHSDTMWKLRGHPALVETLADIYQCDPKKMCVSFDTLGIRYSPEYVTECIKQTNDTAIQEQYRSYYSEDDMEPHIDQRFEYNFHETYQGIYAFTSTPNYTDGGLILYPGTHHLHGETLQEYLGTSSQREFVVYPDTFFKMFPDSIPVHIPVVEGEYVIWDSRLLHSSIHIDANRNRRNRIDDDANVDDWWRLNRMVAYLCYHPGEEMGFLETVQDGLRRTIYEIYQKGRGTNHAIHRPKIIELSSKIPSEYKSPYHQYLIGDSPNAVVCDNKQDSSESSSCLSM
jgi:hypothetical protein